jgi:hypothetical protein
MLHRYLYYCCITDSSHVPSICTCTTGRRARDAAFCGGYNTVRDFCGTGLFFLSFCLSLLCLPLCLCLCLSLCFSLSYLSAPASPLSSLFEFSSHYLSNAHPSPPLYLSPPYITFSRTTRAKGVKRRKRKEKRKPSSVWQQCSRF